MVYVRSHRDSLFLLRHLTLTCYFRAPLTTRYRSEALLQWYPSYLELRCVSLRVELTV